MLSPESLISKLDAFLEKAGEDITLRRLYSTNRIASDVEVRAVVRGYDPQELVNEITQQDQKVIISPTEINNLGWPGPDFNPGLDSNDIRIPKKNDEVLTSRGKLTVQAGVGFYIQDILVRIEMRVRGQ